MSRPTRSEPRHDPSAEREPGAELEPTTERNAMAERNATAVRSTGAERASGERAAATGAEAPPPWRIEPLAGWHLPLLGDPAFLPLQPLLQRTALLGLPERLLQSLLPHRPLAPQVLVAFAPHSQDAVGLIVSRPLNRSCSCWQLQHLRTTPAAGPDRGQLGGLLLREAIARGRGASSWIASAASVDTARLAMLREQGFQPLRTDRLWYLPPPAGPALDGHKQDPGNPDERNRDKRNPDQCRPGSWASAAWSDPAPGAGAGLATGLQLQVLNRRTAPLLWHLEQGACPAQLRQLLDRRIDDLLEQSQGRGWMLVDPGREQAVAAVRWSGEHAGGGHDVEFTLQQGWEPVLGPAVVGLLGHAARALGGAGLWLRCELRDQRLQGWLAELGAQERGERVLMARSVWRRQGQPASPVASQRLEAMLQSWQPRRRPLPTPVAPR